MVQDLQKQLQNAKYEIGGLKAEVHALHAEREDIEGFKAQGLAQEAQLRELAALKADVRRLQTDIDNARSGKAAARVRELEKENAALRLEKYMAEQTTIVLRFRLAREAGKGSRLEDEFDAARQAVEDRVELQAKSIQRCAKFQGAMRGVHDQRAQDELKDELLKERESCKRQEKQAEDARKLAELSALTALSTVNEKRADDEQRAKAKEDSSKLKKARDGAPLGQWLKQAMTFQLKAEEKAARASRKLGKKAARIVAEKFFDETPTLQTGQAAEAALGVANLLCVSESELNEKISRGVDAIREEINTYGTTVDKECLHYVLYEAAGSSPKIFSNSPWPRDCDENGVLADRIVEEGVHAGKPMVLVDFVASPTSQRAQLTEAQVVALRLYTTAAFISINGPLRSVERRETATPHPLAATVVFIKEGLSKLRAADTEDRPLDLWRGMRNLEVSEDFIRLGGSERAVMSTTTDESVAIRYGMSTNSLVFKIVASSFMQRGASIGYLSAFPAESEMCYPPLTYLRPTGKMEVVEVTHEDVHEDDEPVVVRRAKTTVVEVEPIIS